MSDSDFSDSYDSELYPETPEQQKRRLLFKYLSRFNKLELNKYVWEDHVDFIRAVPLATFKKSKMEILQTMVEIASDYILRHTSIEDFIGKLDSLYTILRSGMKTWRVFRLGISRHGAIIQDPVFLEDSLKVNLLGNNLEINSSASHLRMEAIWVRLSYRSRFARARTNKWKVMYLQHYPGLRFIFVGGSPGQKDMNSLQNALCETFECPSVEPMELKGSNLNALLVMAIQSEGHLLTDVENLTPGLQGSLKKRNGSSDDHLADKTDLDAPKRRKRQIYLKSILGNFQPPKLNRLLIRAKTKFYGFGEEETEEDIATFEIRFKGPSVLEGLCKMFHQGIIPGKFPAFMKNVLTYGSNVLYLRD